MREKARKPENQCQSVCEERQSEREKCQREIEATSRNKRPVYSCLSLVGPNYAGSRRQSQLSTGESHLEYLG